MKHLKTRENNMNEEILSLVDLHDQEIGQMPRSEIYQQKLSNFRVVNAFLLDDNGRLWIPRRTKNKKLFPLCLDASMGGHVVAGENYKEALARELKEELNLEITDFSYQMIGKLTPHAHGTSAFMEVYVIRTNQAPNFNPNDFCEYFWLTPQELLQKLAAGDQSKGDLPKIIEHLFLLV